MAVAMPEGLDERAADSLTSMRWTDEQVLQVGDGGIVRHGANETDESVAIACRAHEG